MPVYSETTPALFIPSQSKASVDYVQIDVNEVNDHTPVTAVSAEQAALLLPGLRRLRNDSANTNQERKRLNEEIAVLEKVLGEISAPTSFDRRITPSEKVSAVEKPKATSETKPTDTVQEIADVKAPVRELSPEEEAAFQLPGLRRMRLDSNTTMEERQRLNEDIAVREKLLGEETGLHEIVERRITPGEKSQDVEMPNAKVSPEPSDKMQGDAEKQQTDANDVPEDKPVRTVSQEETAAFQLPALRRLRDTSSTTTEERQRLSKEIHVLESLVKEPSFDAALFERRITPMESNLSDINVSVSKADNTVEQSQINKRNIEYNEDSASLTAEQAAILLPGYRRMKLDLQTTQEQRKRLSMEIHKLEQLIGDVGAPIDFARRITPTEKIRSEELPWKQMQADHQEKQNKKHIMTTEAILPEEVLAEETVTNQQNVSDTVVVRPMSKEEAAFALPGFRRMRADLETTEEERQRLTQEIFMLEKIAVGEASKVPARHISRRQSAMW
jgi:hypothetical protein